MDLKNSAPIRPGVPSFGRPEGSNSLAERQGLTTADRAVAAHQELIAQRKSQSDRDVDAIQDIADRFFMRSSPVEEIRNSGWVETESFSRDTEGVEGNWGFESEPSPYTPPGTYLDVEV